MATNGTITKRILKAAKFNGKLSGQALESELRKLMMSFPLSSKHLVYDDDEQKHSIPAGRWAQVIAIAIETDKVKLESGNRWMVSMGGKPDSSLGRYKG
jgi:hypothetical protein